MSYYKIMKQVDEKIGAAKSTKKADLTGSGLLARTKMPVGPTRGTDVTDEIASYIDTIRTRKEELLNGKD
jgi:hypothetical protein